MKANSLKKHLGIMIVEFTGLNIWMIISEVISFIYLLLKFILGNTIFFNLRKNWLCFWVEPKKYFYCRDTDYFWEVVLFI
jgi:hypothetical protein